MISGINLCLGTTEAAILARAAEGATAERLAFVNTGVSNQAGKLVELPPRLGIYSLRPPPSEAALLGTAAMHRRSALLRAEHHREGNAKAYDKINAIATDIRVGLRLSIVDKVSTLAKKIQVRKNPHIVRSAA